MNSLLERLRNRCISARASAHRLPGGVLLWKVVVAVVGLVLVAGGLVLVPLPGPGWLIVFLGLGVWGTEFAWANRLLVWVRAKVSAGTQYVMSLPGWLRIAGSLITVAVVVAALGGYLAWRGWWPFADNSVAAELGM